MAAQGRGELRESLCRCLAFSLWDRTETGTGIETTTGATTITVVATGSGNTTGVTVTGTAAGTGTNSQPTGLSCLSGKRAPLLLPDLYPTRTKLTDLYTT